MKYYTTHNCAGSVSLSDIPVAGYPEFYEDVCRRLGDERCHIGHYFARMERDGALRFYCLLLDDASSEVLVTSFEMGYHDCTALPSLTAVHPQAHPFERGIAERWGVRFDGMPWDKPLRFPFDRFDRRSSIDNYPFYKIDGESLHEVNVGPIHAGIIEPGAFRFVCNGESVLHLEIALGYQHRGVEHEFEATDNRLRQSLLAEAVAGDSAVAHASAFAEAVEKLSVRPVKHCAALRAERFVALELERMAVEIADTGALCTDVGYQLGQVACEALRTMTINTTQAWCGNRFGKGLIRPFGTNFPLADGKVEMIRRNVAEIRRRYDEVRSDIKSSPTLLARFEQCGVVSRADMQRIGAVGLAARASGLERDIRVSHPWGLYAQTLHHRSDIKRYGDVMSRLTTRCREVLQSADYIGQVLASYVPAAEPERPDYFAPLSPSSLAFGLVEGWRGEICHVAVTDAAGRIETYRAKDPSLHNWMALALAVRGEGISDFPICNKSFNLSYCGHDL